MGSVCALYFAQTITRKEQAGFYFVTWDFVTQQNWHSTVFHGTQDFLFYPLPLLLPRFKGYKFDWQFSKALRTIINLNFFNR